MAILLRGKSRCSLCGKIMTRRDEIVAFTAFLRPVHRLHRFSDAAFHRPCFEGCPERRAVEEVYGRFRRIWDSRPLDATLAESEAWARVAFDELSSDDSEIEAVSIPDAELEDREHRASPR